MTNGTRVIHGPWESRAEVHATLDLIPEGTKPDNVWMALVNIWSQIPEDLTIRARLFVPTEWIASPEFANELRGALVDLVAVAHQDAADFLESGAEDRNAWLQENRS